MHYDLASLVLFDVFLNMCLHHFNKNTLKEENEIVRYLRNSRSRTCQGESTSPVGAAVRSSLAWQTPTGAGESAGSAQRGYQRRISKDNANQTLR